MIYLKPDIKQEKLEEIVKRVGEINIREINFFFDGIVFGSENKTWGWQAHDYVDRFLAIYNRRNEIDHKHMQEYCHKFWGDDNNEPEFIAWERGVLYSDYFEVKF